LVRQALAPVEPPPDLSKRMEAALENLTSLAADELEAWADRDKKDPRNWVRIGAAIGVGASAGAALVVLRTRKRARKRNSGAHPREIERVAKDVAAEARKILRAT